MIIHIYIHTYIKKPQPKEFGDTKILVFGDIPFDNIIMTRIKLEYGTLIAIFFSIRCFHKSRVIDKNYYLCPIELLNDVIDYVRFIG
jgi:hypothetical protein